MGRWGKENTRDEEGMLPVWDAQRRAEMGARELEEAIDEFNGHSLDGEDYQARHKDLQAHFMTILAETYGIEAPTYIKATE